MKELSLFALIMKQTRMKRFLLSFGVVFLICTLLIWAFDPDMQTWWDAIWYGFMLVTTTGFGDLTVSTLPARLVSVVLGLYGILVIGFICGVGASWLYEKVREGHDESIARMIDQLEHLDTLDDDQIAKLQEKAAIVQAQKNISSHR